MRKHTCLLRQAQTMIFVLPFLSCLTAAQVEETAPSSTCGTFSYELLARGIRSSTPTQVTFNGVEAKFTDTYSNETRSVTLKDTNKIQINWKVLKANTYGNPRAYSSRVTLRLMNGSRVTDIFDMDASDYLGKRELTYNFSAPPKDNIACAKDAYLLQLDGRKEKIVEWTVSVGGKYYLYQLSSTKKTLDLRPFLKKGDNKVTVSWRVIAANGSGLLKDAAFITSDAGGKARRLASFSPKAVSGEKGSSSVNINVK